MSRVRVTDGARQFYGSDDDKFWRNKEKEVNIVLGEKKSYSTENLFLTIRFKVLPRGPIFIVLSIKLKPHCYEIWVYSVRDFYFKSLTMSGDPSIKHRLSEGTKLNLVCVNHLRIRLIRTYYGRNTDQRTR